MKWVKNREKASVLPKCQSAPQKKYNPDICLAPKTKLFRRQQISGLHFWGKIHKMYFSQLLCNLKMQSSYINFINIFKNRK